MAGSSAHRRSVSVEVTDRERERMLAWRTSASAADAMPGSPWSSPRRGSGPRSRSSPSTRVPNPGDVHAALEQLLDELGSPERRPFDEPERELAASVTRSAAPSFWTRWSATCRAPETTPTATAAYAFAAAVELGLARDQRRVGARGREVARGRERLRARRGAGEARRRADRGGTGIARLAGSPGAPSWPVARAFPIRSASGSTPSGSASTEAARRAWPETGSRSSRGSCALPAPATRPCAAPAPGGTSPEERRRGAVDAASRRRRRRARPARDRRPGSDARARRRQRQ